MKELIIFKNEDNTEFSIGWDYEDDFDSCTDAHLATEMDEKILTQIQQSFGASTEYLDFVDGKIKTVEEYNEHFENYNSDESYIVPITVFKSRDKAEECLKLLEEMHKKAN